MRRSRLFSALAVLLSLALGACTQGSFPDLWKKNKFDKLFAHEFCGGFADLLGLESDDDWARFMFACTDRYTEPDGSVRAGDFEQRLGLELAGVTSRSAQAAAKNQAWQTGEMLLGLYVASGKVKANKFPAIAVGVPDTPALKDVLVRAALFDPEKGQPKLVFKSLEATLRTVDLGSGSTVVGEGSAKFTKKDPFALVPFENVVTDQDLEVVVEFAGGAIKDAMLILTVGARDAKGLAQGRQSVAPRAPASIGAHMIGAQAKVGELAQSGMAFARATGKVKSSDIPALTLDLDVSGDEPVNVNSSVSVVTEARLEPPKKKYLPTSATAILFALEDGVASRVGRSTQKFDTTGGAEFTFEDVDIGKAEQVRVVLEFDGKRVRNAIVMGTASVS